MVRTKEAASERTIPSAAGQSGRRRGFRFVRLLFGAAGVYAEAGFWAWMAFQMAAGAAASAAQWAWPQLVGMGASAAAAGVAPGFGAAYVPGWESQGSTKPQGLCGALALSVPVTAGLHGWSGRRCSARAVGATGIGSGRD